MNPQVDSGDIEDEDWACSQYFDMFRACRSSRGAFNGVYRDGSFPACVNYMPAFWACMRYVYLL